MIDYNFRGFSVLDVYRVYYTSATEKVTMEYSDGNKTIYSVPKYELENFKQQLSDYCNKQYNGRVRLEVNEEN